MYYSSDTNHRSGKAFERKKISYTVVSFRLIQKIYGHEEQSETETDSLPRKLWGRPSIVWCLPSCPRLDKRCRWGVVLCGLSRSRDWPVQRRSVIAWPPLEPDGENGNSLDVPASPCLLIFDVLSFRSLSEYRPKRGHVVASEHRTSKLRSNISHGPLPFFVASMNKSCFSSSR